MAVSVVTVVSNETDSQEVVRTARVIEVPNTRSMLVPGAVGTATEVVKPGGTVANVTWGYNLPPNPAEGQVFILLN
jgi:hypothetical protein